MIYKVLILDDDAMARRVLERLCAANSQLEVVKSLDNGEDALAFLDEESVDILLLDVEMPSMTGTEFLSHLPNPPAVIFTSAKAEYAYDAFEFQAVDFLKKPITPTRFNNAVEKVLLQKQKIADSSTSSDGIYVKENGKFIRLNPDDILFFETVGDYVRVKTQTGSHLIHGTLKSIDEKLTDTRFLKVHRSYIVNLRKIKDIDEASLVIEKTVIPISRAHRSALMAAIKVI